MKKNIFVVLALILLSGFCSAQFYVMGDHVIEIDVDVVGNAQITERYFLSFQNEQQISDFKQTVGEIGASIDGWRSYDPRIFPRIGQEKDIVVSGILFVENNPEPDFLEINYALKTPIVETRSETSRVIEYSLLSKHFQEFIDGSLWVIPKNTSIMVTLPKGIEIEKSIKPDAAIEENTVVWEGYVVGNELSLRYRFFKQISSFNFNETIGDLAQSDAFWLVAGIVVIVSIIIFVQRKKISGKIESYLIAHSDLSGEEDED